jgi:hypothetical protein
MALNWTLIDRLAKAHRLIDPTASEKDLFRALKLWFCIKYSRPFKDPLIDSYTLDELVYEYLVHYYLDPANDPNKKKEEEKAAQDDDEWIKKMLAGGLEGAKTQPPAPSVDGGQAPANAQEAPQVAQTRPAEVVPDLPDISTSFEE